MSKKLEKYIKKENKYVELLKNNPKYKLQGWDEKTNKVVVGVIKGNPENYKQYKDHLRYRYFDSWRDAYNQLKNQS